MWHSLNKDKRRLHCFTPCTIFLEEGLTTDEPTMLTVGTAPNHVGSSGLIDANGKHDSSSKLWMTTNPIVVTLLTEMKVIASEAQSD
eukprot:scaffold423003_cov31-Attheya_sp.AAC.1